MSLEKYLKIDWSVKMPLHWLLWELQAPSNELLMEVTSQICGHVLRALAICRWGKNSVRTLQYGPQVRLVRGVYRGFSRHQSKFNYHASEK